MKILYDHQVFTLQNYGGISRYFYGLMNEFNQQDDISISLPAIYSNNYYLKSHQHFSKNIIHENHFNKVARFIKKKCNLGVTSKLDLNQKESEKLLLKKDFDIFHPTYYNPYFLKSIGNKPYVLTIHDMINELYPEYFCLSDRTVEWKNLLAKTASKIIAVSENTKRDIIEFYDIDPDKICVVYHGNPLSVGRINLELESEKLNTLKKDYLLFVGSRALYKNFYFFISSIRSLLLENKNLNVICAGGGPFIVDEMQFLKNLGLDNKVSQYNVDDNTLANLYKRAIAFIYPSLYEGFGIPILEAFACGCPVIVSNTSSLPEVGGEAAIYFDPKSIESIKSAVDKIVNNSNLKVELRVKGFKQLEKFSLESTARKTKCVYQSLI